MKRGSKQDEDGETKHKVKTNDFFQPTQITTSEVAKPLSWKKIRSENLDCDMTTLYSRSKADKIFLELEERVQYNTGKLAKVQIYGKWRDIPRKQVAFGDAGLSYTFSGNTIPAKEWLPILLEIRGAVEVALHNKWRFNFVLVNRYNNGNDHMGEHRDDEKDLDRAAPIASVSLGQERDFVFKHKDARGKNKLRTDLNAITISLKSGSLLVMNPPTNDFWYHSLPVRKRAPLPRINLTFRVMTAQTPHVERSWPGSSRA